MRHLKFIVCLFLFPLVVGCAVQKPHVQRFGRIAKIRADKIEQFKALHETIWPEVSDALRKHKIQNYSIYLKDLKEGEYFLFSYFESRGRDAEVRTAAINADEALQRWEKAVGEECLAKISADDSSWWVDMEEVFYFDGAADVKVDESSVMRLGQVIGVTPRMVEPYKYIHAHAWPEILDAIKRGNIRNYPIFMTEIQDEVYIFGYFEYVGNDFDADMAMVDGQPATKAWIKFTDEACQLPIPTRARGEWWATMEEVFHKK